MVLSKDMKNKSNTIENKIMEWLYQIADKAVLKEYESRLNGKERQKNKAISEIFPLYYLVEYKRFEIVEFAPKGKGSRLGEFIIKKDNIEIWCEVKSPGWEKEFADKKEYKRTNQPKYKCGECRAVNNSENIRYAIDKSYEKFLNYKINLLIVNDDFHISFDDEVYRNHIIYESLYYKKSKFPIRDKKPQGYYNNDNFKNLSGLATYNYEQQHDKHLFYTFLNPRALNEIPSILFETLNAGVINKDGIFVKK